MPTTLFIDGHSGTIGLRIRDILASHNSVSVLQIPEKHRKDPSARRDFLNSCDVAILCLPDEASVESVSFIENPQVRIIDGSTAFRVSDDWVYGLPELSSNQRDAIHKASRVSNPGCWATAVNLLTRPLVSQAIVPPDIALSIHGVSGYTGGGKAAIQRWESDTTGLINLSHEAPYALDEVHKHIPEIQLHGLLRTDPYFSPAIGAFARGMRVQIPLHALQLNDGVTSETIRNAYESAYAGECFVRVVPQAEDSPINETTFDPQACNNTNNVLIHVIAQPSGHVLLMAILDNLGKGASGAAVQSLNLMLGLEEECGL
ncbi:MAG: N-acetyl-gamma-glutamyl-phosphate reductase [Verrucomicrobiota bacterium]